VNQPLEVAIALVWQHERLLVTRRPSDSSHLPGYWEFPGGKLEPGETPERCAVREVLEEIGLHVAPRARRTPIHHSYPRRSVLIHPIDCDYESGEIQLIEVSAARWLRPDELLSLSFPDANRELIRELASAAAR
jgi:mutator protein MutT